MGFVQSEGYECPPDSTRLWRYYALDRFEQFMREGLFLPSFATLRTLDDHEAVFTEGELRHMEEASRDHRFDPPLARQVDYVHAKNVYLSCWCASEQEGTDMWHAYAGAGGVAVVTTVACLKEIFDQNDSPMSIGRCSYDRDPLATGHAAAHELFLRKRHEYRHEQEVRAVLLDPRFPRHGMNLQVDHARLVQRVVLSPGASESLRLRVEHLLQEADVPHGRLRPSTLDERPPPVP